MSELEKPFDIPEHWHWSTFDEIGEWTGGATPSKRKTSYWEGDIPWVSPKDMKRLEIDDTQDHVTETALEDSATNRVPADSLLFVTRSGILERTLPTARATVPVTINQDLKALTLSEEINPKFLLHYTRAAERSILRQCSKHGTTVASLESGRLYRFPVPLPPLPEQRRNVAKVEELFSNLDAGRADLQTAGQQLERYRLSVLQAAVEGRLTADWRRTHDPEPADRLLDQILEKRREQWEERYKRERYTSKEKKPPSGWKDRYTEPKAPETEELVDLPEGWTWATLQQLGEWTGGNTPRRSNDDYWENGTIPWVSPKDMDSWEIHETEDCMTELAVEEANAKRAPEGSILFVTRSSILQRTLPVAIARVEVTINQDLKALRMPSIVNEDYVLFWALARNGRLRYDCMKDGTTVQSLRSEDLYSYPIPLPSLTEQKQIVDEVERLLSVADDAAATAEREETRAEQLRQSILKQAFSGQLVPHDEDTSPPSIDGAASERPDSETSDGADSDVENLLGAADPSKQIEMDL
jgi:type I restriction enzyme S subunit